MASKSNSKEIIPIYRKESGRKSDEIPNPAKASASDEKSPKSESNDEIHPGPSSGTPQSQSTPIKSRSSSDGESKKGQSESNSKNSFSDPNMLTKKVSPQNKSKSGSLKSQESEKQINRESIENKSKSGSIKSLDSDNKSVNSVDNKSKSGSLNSEKIGDEETSLPPPVDEGSAQSLPEAQESNESQIPEFCDDDCYYEGNRCHSKRFEYYLETGLESDVTFIVGENKSPIKAHKLILMIGSPVFRNLLCEDRTKETYDITDLNDDTFLQMLHYVYTGDVPLKVENALPLLDAAEKYKIPELSVACGVFLKSTLTNETAIHLYQEARKYGNSYLEKGALDIICKNASTLVETDSFLELEVENLEKILEQDNLAVFDEVQLFDAVLRWAKAECKRQGKEPKTKYMKSILKGVIHLIRFPQMDSGDFSMKVAESKVLEVEELVSLLLYFNVKDERKSSISSGIFNQNPRKYFTPSGEKYIVQRLRPSLHGPNLYACIPMTNAPHCIKLKVSRSVWILSIGLNSPSRKSCSCSETNLQIKLKFEDYTNKKILCKKKLTLVNPSRLPDEYHMEMDKPVHIKADLWHILSFRIAQGDYFGLNYESVEADNVSRNKKCDKNNNNGSGTSTIHYHCKDEQDVWWYFEDVPSSSPYTNTKMGYLPEFCFQIE